MRVPHDVRVWIAFELWLVAVLVVVWDRWVLEDQSTVGADKRLVGSSLAIESIL